MRSTGSPPFRRHLILPWQSCRERRLRRHADPPRRFVTAALHVDYLRPTPIGVPLEVRGRVEEITERKVVISRWI